MIQDRQTTWIASMDTIPCVYNYFTAFELELDARYFDKFTFMYQVFVHCLFERSAKMPLKCGHESLFAKAAVDFVELVKPYALEFYADRGRTLDWSERDYAALAIEVADRMRGEPALKKHAMAVLQRKRTELYISDATIAQSNLEVAEWHPNVRNIRANYKISMRSCELNTEGPIETFVRILDYIEHVKHLPAYPDLFTVKRLLTSYLRVGRSVFEQWRSTGS